MKKSLSKHSRALAIWGSFPGNCFPGNREPGAQCGDGCRVRKDRRECSHTSCQVERWRSTSSGSCPKMSENTWDRRMMSSQPWSESQVHGFFHLLFSREMFPNHREKRVTATGCAGQHTDHTPHFRGSCFGERSLCQGVRMHGLFLVTSEPNWAAWPGLQSQHSPWQRCRESTRKCF